MTTTRTETDSFGPLEVPADKYWGAQTQRSLGNFKIGTETMPAALVRALGIIKKAAALTNVEQGLIEARIGHAIAEAADKVIAGELDDNFPLVVWQTGSGTQSNMNANEVIANCANEILGGGRGTKSPVHPNDHVNRSQSSNDTFPTAMHISAAEQIHHLLLPSLGHIAGALEDKASAWSDIIKIGRTHLQDATPLTLGQEFSGYATQVRNGIARVHATLPRLYALAQGGTAVGTGINTHPEFGRRVAEVLANQTGLPLIEAENHFEANAQRDGLVECHGQLRAIAVTLFNLTNNIRWLSSGPRCGFQELQLPTRQPGSSIMPGKVNPVMCESAMQVAARVMGNDQAIAVSGAAGGNFQLNIMMPMMGQTTLESVSLLASVCNAFVDFCAEEMEANTKACEDAVEKSLSLVTSLNPYIGYEKAAALAKEAFRTGKTIRELCTEQDVLPPQDLEKALNPLRMTSPQAEAT